MGRYSKYHYCGKASDALSIFKRQEDLFRREIAVRRHQCWKVMFPHSLGNWEGAAKTVANIKTEGMPLTIPLTLGKIHAVFSGRRTWERIALEKSSSDSLLVCENSHWREILEKQCCSSARSGHKISYTGNGDYKYWVWVYLCQCLVLRWGHQLVNFQSFWFSINTTIAIP